MTRVPYLTRSDLPPEYRDLFEVDEDDAADVVLNVHRAMANNPRLLAAWTDWVLTLYREVGPPRTRELTILAVARAVESRYVWHQHVPVALDAELSQAELLALSDRTFEEFPREERALLEYVTAFAGGSVDEGTHRELAAYFDDGMVVTIACLAAVYIAIDLVIDALGVELDGRFVGWGLEHLA